MNVYFVLLIQMCIAGGTHIVAKAVVGKVDPATLTFLRSIFSTAGLLGILLIRRRKIRIERRDWLKLAWLGFLGLPFNQFLYLYGLKFSTAANGALLYATTPVFVLVFSHFVLKERITAKKTVGVMLAFLGVVVIIFERGIDFSSDFTFGNVMILIAVLAWTFFTIQGRQMVVKYGAVQTTSVAMILGMLMFLPVGIVSSLQVDYSQLTISHWLGVAYLGLGTSVVGYMLWYYALGRIEASKAAVFANGQPVLATILSLIFLDYSLTTTFIMGGLVTLAGVILTQQSE